MNAAPASPARGLLRDHRIVSIAALVIVTVFSANVFTLAVDHFMVLTSADRFIEDWEVSYLSPTKPVDPDIRVVKIDENTLASMPYRSPIDRDFLADVIAHVAAGHPKAIGLDILLDRHTVAAKDNHLRDVLAGTKVPLVIAYTDDPLYEPSPDQVAYLRAFVPPRLRAWVNLAKDQYGTVRWIYPGAKDRDGHYVLGFDRALARYAGHSTPNTQFRVVWTRPPKGDASSFFELPANSARILPPVLASAVFRDKVVLIGTDETLEDRHRTPFATASKADLMPGIIVHAYGLATILDRAESPYVGWAANFTVALTLSLIGSILGILNFGLVLRILALAAILVVFWICGAATYVWFNMMFGLLAPSLASIASFSGLDSISGRDARKQRKFIQGAFSRYVSPKVVEALIADPTRMTLEGERREMSYIFTDVADFTTLSEGMDTSVLGRVLNSYFEGVTSIVLRQEGMVDKFIGDGVFAIFNAPVDLANHQERAVKCALEIDEFCEKFREEQKAAGVPFGVTRVGVHTGTAVIGNFGSHARFNYTAQGDAVNTASRLEGINKYFGTRISVSGETHKDCPSLKFRQIASVVLKGKTQAVDVWEPLRENALTAEQRAKYDAAFANLAAAPDTALAMFEELARELPKDPCVQFHLQRLHKGIRGAELSMTEK